MIISQILHFEIASFSCKAHWIIKELEYDDDVSKYGLGTDDGISDDPKDNVPQEDETQPSVGGSAEAGAPLTRPNQSGNNIAYVTILIKLSMR